ncbi:allergen Asp F13 [Pyronema omphalodes]|nr:allergen Asp F13 [Pyronema omphalodes]
MQFSTIFLSAAALLPITFAAPSPASAVGPTTGTADIKIGEVYDNPGLSMLSTSCSDGVYGLVTKWSTVGAVPNYPFVGAGPMIQWNSPQCGNCFSITYQGRTTKTIYVTAIDSTGGSMNFNIATAAFSVLTGGNTALGSVKATYAPADMKMCAFPSS